MTNLIDRDDPQFFEQTSDIPYDRHHYKVVTTTNEYIFDDYEQVRQMWWNYDSSLLKHVEVIDKPKTKKKKGFGQDTRPFNFYKSLQNLRKLNAIFFTFLLWVFKPTLLHLRYWIRDYSRLRTICKEQ